MFTIEDCEKGPKTHCGSKKVMRGGVCVREFYYGGSKDSFNRASFCAIAFVEGATYAENMKENESA